MAKTLGRDGNVAISDDGGTTFTVIGEISDFSSDKTFEMADVTTFTSAGSKEELIGEHQIVLSFTGKRDLTDAGQVKLRTAHNGTGTQYHYRVRQYEDVGTEIEYEFQGSITTLAHSNARNEGVEFTCTVNSTGAITVQTQA